MHRRFALGGIAAASSALIAGAALGASSNVATSSSNPSSTSSPGMAAGSAMPMTSAMGPAEQKHVADTSKVGALSLATSRIAVNKADHPKVKEFAEFETAEQETVADVLNSMKMPADQAKGALVVPSDAAVTAMLDADDKAMVEKLRGLSGKAFDTAYIKAQTDGHDKLLSIQETYLRSGNNRENLNVAKLARGMIKEHLKHLASLPEAL